jgi:hypothetical protein
MGESISSRAVFRLIFMAYAVLRSLIRPLSFPHENCASCRAALANIQQLKLGSMILGAIALILTPILFFSVGQNPLIGISLSSILLTSVILWFSLNQLEKKFYQGNLIPPRNLPNKREK